MGEARVARLLQFGLWPPLRTMTEPSPTRGRDRVAQVEPVLKAVEFVLHRIPVPARHRALQSARRGRTLSHRAWRYVLLRSLTKNCGAVVDVREDVFVYRPELLSLGSHVSIHPLCYIDATGGIDIGDDVSIAHGVSIMSTEHRLDRVDIPIRDQGVSSARVSIGDDIWIGAGARILAGVTIGSGAIIGAGAVVTRDVEPRSIVGGVPARVLRERRA